MKATHRNDTLIVYLKQPSDWKIVKEYGIYRIRSWIKHPPKILANRSVKHIAFYLPSIFGKRKYLLFPTTFEKLETAPELNFLFNGSHLEEKMWTTLLDNGIYPEREWPIKINQQTHYRVDFAVFCRDGHFCIEIDGQQHLEKAHVRADVDRTNHTNTQNWKTYRFYESDLQAGKTKTPQLSLFSDAHLDFLNLRRIVKERFERSY